MNRLSKPQETIYEMDRAGKGSIASIAGTIFFHTHYSPGEICDALHQLLERCGILSTRIVVQNGRPMQHSVPFASDPVSVMTFCDEQEYQTWAERQARERIDIFGPLCRFVVVSAGRRTGVFCLLHHIIADGWSFGLLANRLCQQLETGTMDEITPYPHCLVTEEKYMNSRRHEKDEEFWLSTFEANPEPAFLSEKAVFSQESGRKTFVLSPELSAQIQSFCQSRQISEYAVFMSAVSAWFRRQRGKDSFYLGTPVLNRSTTAEKNMAGVLVNTVPLPVHAADTDSFESLCGEITSRIFSMFRHQKYTYSELLQTLRAQKGLNGVLYDVIVSFQNTRVPHAQTLWHGSGEIAESLQIHIDDRSGSGQYHLSYDYQIQKFSDQTVARMHEQISNLLADGLSHPDKPICRLEMLTAFEQHALLHAFNDTDQPFPKNTCVHQLFEQQAALHPDKAAVKACGQTRSYSQLNEDANRIAHALIRQGVRPKDRIAFQLKRTSRMMAAIFGILKTGAAYIPIDPKNPQDRIDYILSDSQARMCLTDVEIARFLENGRTDNPDVSVSSDAPCYCIYTSGSTGRPKGTLISHRSACSFARSDGHSVRQVFRNCQADSILGLASAGFDMFITESLLPLANGMTIILADEKQTELPEAFYELFDKEPDILETTPSKMRLMLSAKNRLSCLSRLKVIILGGEEVDSALVRQLRKWTDAQIFNFYGPTECTVWATFEKIEDDDSFTIGRPMANTKVCILGTSNELLPLGAVGEICIAGECVSLGYLNRPELTREKFIDNPFGSGKLYKTGDLGFWNEQGRLVYIGRSDFQVKIRGLRVELGEIEDALKELPEIDLAAVTVRKDETGRQYICAFYTGAFLEPRQARNALSTRLPRYMIPHIFTWLENMPMTPSGKTDRKALPETDLSQWSGGSDYMPPQNETERLLASLMEQVLHHAPIGRNDDFFDLGGDSLKAIELLTLAQEKGLEISLQQIYDHPTIARLAQKESSGSHFFPDSKRSEQLQKLSSLLERNVSSSYVPACSDPGHVLLDGATGFLGAHILESCLTSCKGDVWCIVRGSSSEESQRRLTDTLIYYFGKNFVHRVAPRVHVLCADLEKSQFGLDDAQYQTLAKTIHTIIHAAALVKHYGNYEDFEKANVVSTKNLIDFARAADARLLHISTTSVFGMDSAQTPAQPAVFSEKDFWVGQSLENVYARSKFEAEAAVLQAIEEGLQANILRMGNLSCRTGDGKFQPNYKTNANLNRIRALTALGVVPDYLKNAPVEFTPIDEAAAAVVLIARHFNMEKIVFHIENCHMLTLEQMVDHLRANGAAVRWVNEQEFASALALIQKDSARGFILEALVNDLGPDGRLAPAGLFEISTAFTADYLGSLGFSWSETGNEYFKTYLNYFRALGWLSFGYDNPEPASAPSKKSPANTRIHFSC